ncbi:lactaldehyde reductase (propanediol oxidoreductase) [Escherichia coli]|nr:lactaldehyde reductase (propanediol oxidoreductase) [Escherichia coli]
MRSLEGLSPTNKPSVPILAIPTTAGTAAEVTINYVITDEEKRRKLFALIRMISRRWRLLTLT